MKEQFDKVFRDHIKDTFDEYDDGLSHDGWLQYQRKLRNKKRRAVLLWTLPSGVAASLLLLLFFKADNTFENRNDNQIIARTQVEKEIAITSAPDIKNPELASEVEAPIPVIRQHTVTTPMSDLESSENIGSKHLIYSASESMSKEVIDMRELPVKAEELIVQNPHEGPSITTPETTTLPGNLFNENETPVYAEVSQAPPSSFAYDDAKKDKMPFKNKLRNLRLSLDASTYMNFSDAGINDDINVAVGLVSEYQITKNLSINSGINVNRQSSSFTQTVPAPQDNIQNAMALTNSIASVVNGQFTNAKLVGLDIPFNIRYSTANKKLNWFVSSGISSYALINEKYFNNFSVTSFAFSGVETSTVSTVEEHSENPISSFQLARSLNFSFGISFPLKKVTTLSIEPFIKYPLRQFGQQNLTLGASGVSLKMHLNKNLFKN